MKGALGEWLISTLIFVAYFLNFTFADLETSLSIFDSLLSPERTAYIIWIPVYAGLFGFVSYQLLHGSARRSRLIQRKIVAPWIIHQCVYSAWLLSYSDGMLLTTAILGTVMWTLTLCSYLLITIEFRSGRYEDYTIEDWLLIETPFGLQLGWETFLALLGWNVWSVKLTHSTGLATPAIELSAFIVSIALIVQAAVLFAGLPMVMNPWLHVGLGWGCAWVAVRWLRNNQNDITLACGISALAAFATCLVYFLVSLAIMCQSKFCLPEVVEPNPDECARAAAIRERGTYTDRPYIDRVYTDRVYNDQIGSAGIQTHQAYRSSGLNSLPPSLPQSPNDYRSQGSAPAPIAGGTTRVNPERLMHFGAAVPCAEVYDQNGHSIASYPPGSVNYQAGTVCQPMSYQPRLSYADELPSNSLLANSYPSGAFGGTTEVFGHPPSVSPKTAKSQLSNENRPPQTPKGGIPPPV